MLQGLVRQQDSGFCLHVGAEFLEGEFLGDFGIDETVLVGDGDSQFHEYAGGGRRRAKGRVKEASGTGSIRAEKKDVGEFCRKRGAVVQFL